MSKPKYDPDERFKLEADPEDVLRRLLETEDSESDKGEKSDKVPSKPPKR